MRTMTAAHASRGYLLSWLGALVGLLPAVLVPFAAARGACGGPRSCGFGEGLMLIGVIWIGVIVATVVGAPLGVYVALRIPRRAFAGLTTWMFALVVAALFLVHWSAVRVVGEAPGGVWAMLMTGAGLTSPVIARYLALRTADSLRKYR